MTPGERRDLAVYRREQRVHRWAARIRHAVVHLTLNSDSPTELHHEIARFVRRIIRAEARRR